MKKHLLVIAIMVLLAVLAANLTVFEDGSFRLFDLTGCLPGGLCN